MYDVEIILLHDSIFTVLGCAKPQPDASWQRVCSVLFTARTSLCRLLGQVEIVIYTPTPALPSPVFPKLMFMLVIFARENEICLDC